MYNFNKSILYLIILFLLPEIIAAKLPVAVTGNDYMITEGESITFDGSSSYDPDGDLITSYKWIFAYGHVRFLI